jgi:carbon-monoxide dehydrogenase large subunit
MTTHATPTGFVGRSVKRREDQALITGAGCYVDDIQLPGMLHLAVVRSQYPRARIAGIDTAAARAMAGVVTVVTAADLEGRFRVTAPPMFPGMQVPENPALAGERVYAVGAPVAAVVARTRAEAEDAAGAVVVDYDPEPGLVDLEAAVAPGAPLVRTDLQSNICFTAVRESGEVDKAFAAADHITRLRIQSPRLVAMAMEPRGIVAAPERPGQGLRVWISHQTPHLARTELAGALGLSENLIHLSAPDVGGGFGSKAGIYREDLLACHLALTLGRPVKWVATRSEDFVATNQGRDQLMFSELALAKDATMLGLRVRLLANMGAYLHGATAGPPQRMMGMAPGCYQIRNLKVEVFGVFTNTVSTGPYRGAGRPEAVLNIERLVDQAAREMGIDRLSLRRKNFIRPDQFPYRTATGVEYDSGDYERALDEALRLSDYPALLRRRDERRARGELVGVGVCTFVEPSGGAFFESGSIRMEPSGAVTVLTGSSPHGQGLETTFAQVVADKLGVPMERITVQHSDTVAIQQGIGTFGSRSAIMGGGALLAAADKLIDKGRRVAATLLEAAADDIVFSGGGFAVAGVPNKSVNWAQVSFAAHRGRIPADMEAGLQESASFDPKRESWGFGSHVAMVSVDADTGQLSIEKLVLVDDCGTLINPMIVEGQIHGGVAQGLGEALCEHMQFDEDGQVLSGSLMDYAVLRASGMPEFVMGETETPNPFHPLGVKGVGEAGTNGAPPAVANALMDALEPLGITHVDMPYTAPKLWAAVRAARGG